MSHVESFQPNQRVIFRRGVKWFEGRIISTANNGNHNGSDSYRVQEYNSFCEPTEGSSDPPLSRPGDSYTVTRENIRAFPREKSIMDRMYEAMAKPPPFEDPYAHLYMRNEGVNGKKETITTQDGKKFGTFAIEIPFQEMQGIIGEDELIELVQSVSNRREVIEGSGGYDACDFSKTLKSVLPSERDVARLRERAQSDSSAMLQMADVLRFGLLGVPKDPVKAQALYLTAAYGVSEDECKRSSPWDTKFAYPMGTNEALCAAAMELWYNMVCAAAGSHNINQVVMQLKLEYQSQTVPDWKHGVLCTVVMLLGHALRREWTCPFALALAQPLREQELLSQFLPDAMQLINALECKNSRAEMALTRPGMPASLPAGMPKFSTPSEYQLERFRPHATRIFSDLPVRTMNPSGLCRCDLHVEYREMPFPPYPIMVICLNPQSTYNYDPIELPKEYEYAPFSRGAFEYIWGSLVFNAMHKGVGQGIKRFRPALITFADRPGDRLLASYIKNAVWENCGTEIRIVNTQTYQVEQYGGSRRKINVIMEDFESRLLEMMRMSVRFSEDDIRSPIEMDESLFNNRVDMPIDELNSKLEVLKTEGNEYFTRGRLQAAKRCYTEAIDLVRVSISLDETSQALLGKLFSNRAACFLKMAEGMNPGSAKAVLTSALHDCEMGLKGACARVLPASIKAKLEGRKEKAIAGINRIVSQSSRMMISEYMGERTLDGTTQQMEQQQDQRQRQRRRGRRPNTRSGRKKKKQQQRRRQREQRNRQQAQASSVGDQEEESEEDEPVVSVTLGKELAESNITSFVSGREDPCPCCFDRFGVELSDTYTAVNSCGHAYCLPCLSVLRKKSTRGSNPIPFTCPVCRIPIPEDVLSDAVDPILSCNHPLQTRMASMPLDEEESRSAIHELLFRHNFTIPDVLSSLDSMLTDGLQASLRCANNLTPSEKQEIYENARRPVDVLWNEANALRSKMNQAHDLESNEYTAMKERLKELQTALIPAATKSAVDFIWGKMNTAGTMGAENELGEIEIDFHALHVREAIERFDEQVVPILPAVGSVLLVVGRGNHSDGGVAKLKPALKRHIEKHSKICHHHVKGNEGMIRVEWIL